MQNIILRISFVAALAASGATFGGCDGDNDDTQNKRLCEEYVDDVNAEYDACGDDDGKLDKEETCPDTVNRDGQNCTEYYPCLAKQYECTDAGVVEYDDENDCPGSCE